MTIINPKSIAGVTSITTASGADNLLTVHTNNTTERVRINNDGDVIVGSGITVSPDGDIFATGVTTATTFSGSGASLTNLPAANLTGTLPAISGANLTNLDASDLASGTVPTARLGSGTASSSTFLRGDSTFAAVTSTTINSNTNNYLITGTGTSDTLQGESDLQFDGAHLTQAIEADAEGFDQTASGNHYIDNIWNANRSIAGSAIGRLTGQWNGTEVASMKYIAGADTTNKDDAHIVFFTATSGSSNAERLRITSEGKIGIGLDSPNCMLHIQDAAISGYGSQSSTLLVVEDSGDSSIEIASGHNNTGSIFFGDTGSSAKAKIQYFHGSGGDNMRFTTNDSERMRILSDGSVLIGQTTEAFIGSLLQIKNITVETDGDTTGMYFNRTDSASSWVAMRFYVQGSQKGYIQVNTGSVTYSTSSDYRLKENVVSISDGITRLKQLKPYRFNFKSDSSTTLDGFYAHEASEVVPESVVGTKDAVDSEGNIDPQGIDQSKLVPLLTAALQEAVTKIEVLETRLNNAGIAT